MMKKQLRYLLSGFLLVILLILAGCYQSPPDDVGNICSIFRQYPSWYWSAEQVHEERGIPIGVLMAIIYQESGFHANAKPPRERLLWIIPWRRPTSAYGYSQAVKSTWANYRLDTHRPTASRDAFSDAADFIGWYAQEAQRKLGISKHDAYDLYLAYHEGFGGYSRGSYLHQYWLIEAAHRVQHRAWVYQAQLDVCQASLPKKPWWHLW